MLEILDTVHIKRVFFANNSAKMPSHALKSILKPTRAGFLVDSRGEVTVVEREQRPRKRVSFAVPEIEVKANEEEPTRPLS